MPRLLLRFREEVRPALKEKFGIKNDLAVPRLVKICVNMGVGRAIENRKRLEDAVKQMATISGQKPVICKAKRSVSAFRLRQGQEIGCRVMLRGRRMYEFLDRLISLVLPRIRDFRGLPADAFDGRGNYSLGLTEQGVFPEIDPAEIEFNQGMDVTLVATGGSDEKSREMLALLGMPFRQPGEGIR
jgi:large subunit ribosomal protein L5